MLDQSLTKENLVKLCGKTNIKFNSGHESKESFLEKETDKIASKLNSDSYRFSGFRILKSPEGDSIYNFNEAIDELAVKKLNDNIRRLFKIRPSDRHTIVKQVISLARDESPFHIIRLDIKKFYESCDRKQALEFIKSQWLISYQSRLVMDSLEGELTKSGCEGLPRGISVSSSYSELILRNFDKYMRRIDGVYYYARYVDDIIIFTTKNPNEVIKTASNILGDNTINLSFNESKEQIISMVNNSEEVKEFTFLGYKISITHSESGRKIRVSLSKNKFNKITNRIEKSLRDYYRNRDYNLLSNRLRFLSGNQFVIGDDERSKLKSGIYYNYPLLNNIEDIKKIDTFYQKLIRSKKAPTSKAINLLTEKQQNSIKSISFRFGFERRIINNFTSKEFLEIKRIWS